MGLILVLALLVVWSQVNVGILSTRFKGCWELRMVLFLFDMFILLNLEGNCGV